MIKDILSEREKTHGDFIQNSGISQEFKKVMHDVPHQLNHIQQEALEMIFHKIARILAGDPDFEDHWIDIAGFATLAVEKNKI